MGKENPTSRVSWPKKQNTKNHRSWRQWAERREILDSEDFGGLLAKGDRKGEAEEGGMERGWSGGGETRGTPCGASTEGWRVWELSNHPALGTLGGLSKEPSGVEGPLTFGPGPGFPFLGLPWIGWDFLAQGHPVGAGLPASSPAQRERGQLWGHTFWAGNRGGDEFRELPPPRASGLSCGLGNGF